MTPWYLISAPVRACRCGARAKMELFNTYNASCGWWCISCGIKERDDRNRELSREIEQKRKDGRRFPGAFGRRPNP